MQPSSLASSSCTSFSSDSTPSGRVEHLEHDPAASGATAASVPASMLRSGRRTSLNGSLEEVWTTATWVQVHPQTFGLPRPRRGWAALSFAGLGVPFAGGGVQVVSAARAATNQRLLSRLLRSDNQTRGGGVLVTGLVCRFGAVSSSLHVFFGFSPSLNLSEHLHQQCDA